MEYHEHTDPIEYFTRIQEKVLEMEDSAQNSFGRGEFKAGLECRRHLRELKKLIVIAVSKSLEICGPPRTRKPL